jgi:hypothetical protein
LDIGDIYENSVGSLFIKIGRDTYRSLYQNNPQNKIYIDLVYTYRGVDLPTIIKHSAHAAIEHYEAGR